MGYREILQSYLKLSRKDLQGLCKEYKLPANRSHTELAKSLASLFKKKNVFPAHLTKKKKKIHVTEVTYSAAMVGKSTVLRSIGIETVNPSGTKKDFAGECERRTNSSESESIHLAALMKDKALEAKLENVCSHPVVEGKREGASYPTSKSKDGDRGPTVLADARGFLVDSGPIYKYDGNTLELRSSVDKLLTNSAVNSETDKAVEDMINHMGTAPGNEPDNNICKRVTPSFQFFVASEEGLDLFVDLDSSPADWISGLKEEICINHKFSICGHNKSLVDADMETLKLGNSALHAENMATVGRNTGCTSSSSLSSAISENHHYEVHPLDATVVNSNQPPLAMSSVEISVCLGEGQLCSDGQNYAVSDSAFCHTDKNIILQERGETPLTMERSNVSVAAEASNPCDDISVLKHNDTEHASDVGKIAYRSATCNTSNEMGQVNDLSEVSVRCGINRQTAQQLRMC